MSKFTYKTKDGSSTGFVPGVGAIVDGQISSDTPIESPNLQLVNDVAGAEPQPAPIVATASQQNPNQPLTADAPDNTGVQQ